MLNIKIFSPLKLRSGLTGNYHAICHYSYNFPLATSLKEHRAYENLLQRDKKKMEKVSAQMQECGSTSLQPSLHRHTHMLF